MSLQHPHPEPRSYPLMLRTWTYVWWRPVVGLLALPDWVQLIVRGVVIVVGVALYSRRLTAVRV